ncbi:UvrD-helicase domain-containing protein [Anaerobiospirillum succiniciproducens]|uniref:ATP-dependent helicase n=1 Tax=Anaerobiospirillum succiniciproducens TaxID=13335 RepID=UPI003F8A7914
MSEWLDVLNEEQRTAVEITEGYVCLHAGAGTGKTKTLTYRYAYLISEYGISPRSVWCVTFTNKAAAEMKERVKALCGNAIGNPFITTFHGFCASFLREEISVLGWPKTFTIADVNDVKEILRPLYKECDINGKELNLRKAWEFIDSTKETKDYIPDFVGDDSSILLDRSSSATEDTLKLYWRYLFAQRSTYTLDFDDLILLTLHILKNFPEVRQRWQERLEYILVDEFQDIDRDQYELVEILAGFNQNLFIVGDPDQTIYSFRGARVEYFKGFVDAHADEDGVQLHLTKNYRSQGNILQAAYSVISNNLDPERLPLEPMRGDITLDDMVSVIDPNYEPDEELSKEVAREIQNKSYLGNAANRNVPAALAQPEQTLYYDPTQDESYESPFGDEDFSSIFEDDCDEVIPEEFSTQVGKPMYDRLKKTVGYKKENKLRRVGINFDANDESSYASAGNFDGSNTDLANASFANLGSQDQEHNAPHTESYFPPIGTATTKARGRYGAQQERDNYYKKNKPKSVHTLKPIVAHAGNSFIEAKFVGRTIKDIQRHDPEASIAVLYRSHFIALILEQELAARKIVYNMVGDLSFFDRKEIRDVIAYVRLRVNLDDDVAFRRIANVPPRRFGKKRMERLEEIARNQRCSLYRALSMAIDDPFLNPSNNMSKFIEMMNKLAAAPFRSPNDDLEIILNDSGYDEFLKQSGEDERLEKLASLRTYLSDFKKNHDDDVNLADFIGQIALMNSLDANQGIAPVSLMTVHNAKGLEFDYVFVISLNESIFPTKNSINEQNVAEERRLMYVAMTRACKQLFLVEAGGELLNRAKKERYTREPSRFIGELKDQDFISIGKAPEKVIKQQAVTHSSYNPELLQVGERFHHKILGYGHVLEVRVVEGEYVVWYEKLNKQRTLSFSHSSKIERLSGKEAKAKAIPQVIAPRRQLAASQAPTQAITPGFANHPSPAQAYSQAYGQGNGPVQAYGQGNAQVPPQGNGYAYDQEPSYGQHNGYGQDNGYGMPAESGYGMPAENGYSPAANGYGQEQYQNHSANGTNSEHCAVETVSFEDEDHGSVPSEPYASYESASSPFAKESDSPFGANPFAEEEDENGSMSVSQFLNCLESNQSEQVGKRKTAADNQRSYSRAPAPRANNSDPYANEATHGIYAATNAADGDGAYAQQGQRRVDTRAMGQGRGAAPVSNAYGGTSQGGTAHGGAINGGAQNGGTAHGGAVNGGAQNGGGYRPNGVSSYELATEKFKDAGYSYGLPQGFNLYQDDVDNDE